MALGWTQPLIEMGTRNTFWGNEGGRCLGLATLPHACTDYVKNWECQPPGTLRGSVHARIGLALALPLLLTKHYSGDQIKNNETGGA
jgi:hypothetical protein